MDASEWLPTAAKANGVSEICKTHAVKIFDHLIKLSPWAYKMIDATSKIPESVLDGNLIDFGNYEECIDVQVHEKWGSFLGQHCIAILEVPVKVLPSIKALKHVKTPVVPLGYSICTPSTCTPSDLQSAVSLVANNIVIDPLLCHTKEDPPISAGEWTTLAIAIILALLCCLSSMYDLLITDKERRNKWALVFSIYTNGKSVFGTESGPDSFRCLHGIKVISIIIIILGHVGIMSKAQPTVNYLHYIKQIKNMEYILLTNAPLAVDTFFVISGLLLTYIFMKSMDAGHRFNLPAFYLHRIMRITPSLAMVMLVNGTLLRRFSYGPIWDYFIAKTEGKYCSEYWWSTLLYIQNYVNTQENCVLTSWFLAVDMQMYIISPIFLLLLYKRRRLGCLLLGVVTVIGIIISFAETYVHEDDPDNTKPNVRLNDRYYYTHTRYVSWIMGMAGGYFMYKTIDWRNKVKSGTKNFPQKYVITGWVLFAISLLGSILALYPFQQEDHVYSAVEASFYFAFTRPLWSLCILWLIFACESGFGGLLNRFLRWHGFVPLSHLTFSIYLCHFNVIATQIFSAKVPGFSDFFHLGGKCLDVLFLSTIVAMFLSIGVEMPSIALVKLLLSKAMRKMEQNGNTLQTNDLEARRKQEHFSISEDRS